MARALVLALSLALAGPGPAAASALIRLRPVTVTVRPTVAPRAASASPLLRPAFAASVPAPRLLPAAGAASLGATVRPAARAIAATPRLRPAAAAGTLRALAPAAAKAKAGGGATDLAAAAFDGKKLDTEAFRVPYDPAGFVDLRRVDPDRTPGLQGKGRGNGGGKKAAKKLAKDIGRLQRHQEKLYAEGKRSVLLVFQAMDTGGKDGVIRYVLGPLNPQGVTVKGFKKPTAEEVARGYLWRIRQALPRPGMIGVFNRSQYEDILVPTVEKTLPPEAVEARYAEIRAFEKALADGGVLILKFFLHISKEEQKRRLQARLDDPKKHWKFDPNDLKSRAKWERYRETYGRILARTSTPWAPWYLIPAGNKWYRNFLVGRILRKAMDGMGLRWPDPPPGIADIVIPD